MDDTFDLLVNNRKIKRIEPEPDKIKTIDDADDNKIILNLLKDRMKMGYKKYGHGVQINRDAEDNSDLELAIDNIMDGLICTAMAILRYKRIKEKKI